MRWYLEQVALALREDDRFDPLANIIPMTPHAARRALQDVVSRAQVMLGEPLFDALQSDAKARFKEAGLTKAEQDIMLGSALRVLPGSQEDLISIQNKLDWHFLDGRTYEEAKGQAFNDVSCFDYLDQKVLRGKRTAQDRGRQPDSDPAFSKRRSPHSRRLKEACAQRFDKA